MFEKMFAYAALVAAVAAAVPVAMKLAHARWPSLPLAIALHLLGAVLCAGGIHALMRFSRARPEKGDMWWLFVLAATLLLPAYGSLSMIAIYALQRTRGTRPPPTVSDEITVQSEEVFRDGRPRTTELDILERMDIEPFVDIFRTGGPELKRSAVKFLSAIKTQVAMRTLNRALMSEDIEVRLYAAGVIGLIDDNFTRDIDARQSAYAADPTDLTRALFLAQVLMAYAESGLLDAIAGEYYYREAATLLARMPEGPEVNFMLARALCCLGDYGPAKARIERSLAADATNPAFNKLLCRILFAERAYGELHETVRRLRDERVVSDDDELVKAWA